MIRKKKEVEDVLEENIKPVLEEKVEEAKVEKNASKEKQDANVPEYYTLKIGETLEMVAKKFCLNANKLKDINGEVFGTNQIRLK